MDIKAKVKELISALNEKGIPLPVLQDLVTKKPSITYTFFVVSGVVCLLSSFDGVKTLAKINFNEIKEFFDMCAYIYVGRSAIKMMGSSDNAQQTKTEGEKNE